jgi:hypothetical protein
MCKCKWSTSIADTLTKGNGKLDRYGFWQHPCKHGPMCINHLSTYALDKNLCYDCLKKEKV